MPVTPYFRMIENLALCNWQPVWQSTVLSEILKQLE
jgi:hypothetical protein